MEQQATVTKREPVAMNGVDVPTLFATINAVKDQPELAQFRFRASNRWMDGTHSQSRPEDFDGAGGRHRHMGDFVFEIDHPEVLVGTGKGPAPVEYLMYGLLGCLTAGIGNIAAARGVELTEVESRAEGEIDLRAILGISEEVRNGYQKIRVRFKIRGNAPEDKLRQIIEQSTNRSAVYDVLTNGVPVEIEVDAA
jgi:uncharacterized OsmC-like protein